MEVYEFELTVAKIKLFIVYKRDFTSEVKTI